MADHRRPLVTSAWSELPPDIISRIEKRLDSTVDVTQLHSVCKNWYSSRNPSNNSILSPFLPRIVPNLGLPFTDDRPNAPITLIARAVFLVKPLGYAPAFYGWLLMVEEVVPGKLRILYPLSNDHVKHLPSNGPKYLDLSKFKVSQVAKSYGFKYESDGVDVAGVRRVVFCSESAVMVLFGEGTLIVLRLKSGNWSYVRHSIIYSFSDVISYGENDVRAVDCKGNVHIIDHRATKVVKTISPVSKLCWTGKINLVGSYGKLFAAVCRQGNSPTASGFQLYQLDEVQCNWIDNASALFHSKVLLVSSDWSFFLYTHDLDLSHYSPKPKRKPDPDFVGWEKPQENICGDYVIYSENYFGQNFYNSCRLYVGGSLDLRIGIFFYNLDNVSIWNKTPRCKSTTIDILWPPPTWFWLETYSSTRDDEELDVHSYNALSCSKNGPLRSFPTHTSTSAVTSNKEVSGAKFSGIWNSHPVTIQSLTQNSPVVLFEGVNIKSNLLPTLEKIWGKYGNIVEGSTIRNTDITARALESLATAVIILQSNSGRSLNKDQADYLSSA